jgi:group I intron endonuclease
MTTGAVYVGSSVNCERRRGEHLSELNKGVHSNSYIQRSWNKYGADAFYFQIVEIVKDLLFLRAREQFWINRIKPAFNLSIDAWCSYPENISEIRSRAAKKCWQRPEYRERAVSARKGTSYCKGYRCTFAQIENRRRSGSTSFLGKKHSLETRQRMSIERKAAFASGKRVAKPPIFTEAVKEKMRVSAAKRWHGDAWLTAFQLKYGRDPVYD